MSAAHERLSDLFNRASKRGGLVRLLYHPDLDSASAASLLFASAHMTGTRIMARAVPYVVDASKLRAELGESDVALVAGPILKGEPASYGIEGDVALMSPNYSPSRPGSISPDQATESAALWALQTIGSTDLLAQLRALVGYYSLRCNMLGDREQLTADQRIVDGLVKKGDVIRVTGDTLLLSLRKGSPLDLSLALTIYPAIEGLVGNVASAREILIDSKVCDGEPCPSLEEIEGKKGGVAALAGVLDKLSTRAAAALKGKRLELNEDLGWLSDVSDLASVEEALLVSEGAHAVLAEALQAYPRAALDGLRALHAMAKALPKQMLTLKRATVRGRSVYADLSGHQMSPGAIEALAKAALYQVLDDEPFFSAKVSTAAYGSVYLLATRDRAQLASLLKDAEGYGAHYITSGPLIRLWAPPEGDRAIQGLLT